MAGRVGTAKSHPAEPVLGCVTWEMGAGWDGKNMGKKAVKWALRQRGKSNPARLKVAVATDEEIAKLDARSARLIAADALRELRARRPPHRIFLGSQSATAALRAPRKTPDARLVRCRE